MQCMNTVCMHTVILLCTYGTQVNHQLTCTLSYIWAHMGRKLTICLLVYKYCRRHIMYVFCIWIQVLAHCCCWCNHNFTSNLTIKQYLGCISFNIPNKYYHHKVTQFYRHSVNAEKSAFQGRRVAYQLKNHIFSMHTILKIPCSGPSTVDCVAI